ncbi:hypothetical protein [Ensifer sp. SL37]|uniref:hypothetical protein n=1 Tax=Ensifer sp. SL37 TaxID=2995137 RepID=UPI002273CAD1|nr:hypothetical protein [Ensifer sp. SL37]MCY1740620.1 hypothetical protein [Ensifer sp. SL37]
MIVATAFKRTFIGGDTSRRLGALAPGFNLSVLANRVKGQKDGGPQSTVPLSGQHVQSEAD